MRFYSPRFDYLYQALFLVVLSAVFAVGLNIMRPDPLPFVAGYDLNLPWDPPKSSPAVTGDQEPVVEKDYAEEDETGIVSFNRASYLQRHKEAIFLDARLVEDFDHGHIAGAVSIPLGMFGDEIDAALAQWGKEQRYVVYCSSETCSMSHELAMSMQYSGYTNVLIFNGGMADWLVGGGEVEAK